MTTVAWQNGVIACDKQATSGGTRWHAKIKMRINEHYAYVVSGDLAEGLMFVEALTLGMGPGDEGFPCLSKTQILAMDMKTGKLVIWEPPGYPIPMEDKFYSDGSGADIALGAMAYGATPQEAVRIAAAWDVHTGFGVQVAISAAARKRLDKEGKA